MHLSQSTSSAMKVRPAGLAPFDRFGPQVAVALMCALAGPTVSEARSDGLAARVVVTAGSQTADTFGSSKISAGLLEVDASSLIGSAAKRAIGVAGFARLSSFFDLHEGWDGKGSQPIALASIEQFSRFFAVTSLQPENLGIFMSSRGNVVVNWDDPVTGLVELEFTPDGVEYFVEQGEDEGFVLGSDVGLSALMERVLTSCLT